MTRRRPRRISQHHCASSASRPPTRLRTGPATQNPPECLLVLSRQGTGLRLAEAYVRLADRGGRGVMGFSEGVDPPDHIIGREDVEGPEDVLALPALPSARRSRSRSSGLRMGRSLLGLRSLEPPHSSQRCRRQACRYGVNAVDAETYNGWRGAPPCVVPTHIGSLSHIDTSAPRFVATLAPPQAARVT